LAADISLISQATAFKGFARARTSDTGAVAKQFSSQAFLGAAAPASKGVGEGDSELNGLLFAACKADETAAAGSAPTDGLSAFTWALGRELESGGTTVSVSDLCDRVHQRLLALNMRQTPTVEAPISHGDWRMEELISYAPAGAAVGATAGTTTSDSSVENFLQALGLGAGT
jgi:hypothetical protein